MLRAPRFQGPRAPCALGSLSFLFFVEDLFFFFFFACRLFSQGPAPCMWQGGANSGGGGGADASIGPRALETLGTPLVFSHQSKTTTGQQDKCSTCAFLRCLSHQTCRCLALVWKHHKVYTSACVLRMSWENQLSRDVTYLEPVIYFIHGVVFPVSLQIF